MPNKDPYSGSFTVPDRLHVDTLSFDGDSLTVSCRLRGSEACCPVCGEASRRVHGRYTRTLADLPRGGLPVRLRIGVRKFFCDEPSCERRIFAERLEDVAGVHARGTDRRREALEWIALALGGEAGARLARELGLLVSPDTLLNRIRGAARTDVGEVRVLGVDDFAFRRGDADGTILVDLERRKVVELLPERSAEPLEEWLRQHPGVEVVARDRSFVYARGIAAGAPRRGRWPTVGASCTASPWPWRASCCSASVLDPYVPYLVRRWNEGCHNGRRLYWEIREQGYAHSHTNVERLLAEFRRAKAHGRPTSSVPRARKGAVAGSFPSAKNVAALFMRRQEKLCAEQEDYLERLQALDPALAAARRLTQEFAGMVRNLAGGELDGWLEQAEASEASVVRRFAAGLRKDLRAVRAGLTEEWSNGPVEGFIHKLKLLKRQGYGWADFDLLKGRTFAA
jgi:transposase